jgi:pilus assembly protein CpaB
VEDMRSKLILLMAVVMGIVTTLLFYQYTKKVNVNQTVSEKTVKVVVAKEKIAMNETISAKKITIVQMPEKAVLPQYIHNIEDAEGKIALAVIEKGEPVLSHHLITERNESVYVSRKVREGYRAVTVGVNINQSVSNLIEPEDLVDVVFTKSDQNNQIPPTSTILLEKQRVLAVGRKMVTPDQSKEKYVEYSSVTLECKQQDAVQLINAAQEGKIQFILNKRPAIDEKTNQK